MIFLPVEVPKRDLIGKTLLACSIAKNNIDVVLFEHTFFDRYFWPKNSIYIGKNCFRTETPHNLKYYNKMKKKYVKVFFLDDEGGVYAGKNEKDYNEALKRRLDCQVLNKDDKIFTWGNYQKDYYIEKKTKAKVTSTGYPSFIFLKKKYHKVFNKLDLKITNNLSNYILITTRFGEANPLKKYDYYIGENSGSSNSINDKLSHLKEKSILLPCFIEAIHELSIRYPDLKFVIRPHPEESIEIYEVFFAKHKNVLISNDGPVESWIRPAKIIISYGCTTLLQSEIAEKKIINFEPEIIKFTKSKISMFVDNAGIKATNLEDLLKIFNELLYNDEHSSFAGSDKINLDNVINNIISEIPKKMKKTNLFFFYIIGLIENIKNNVKNLMGIKSSFDNDNLFHLSKNIISIGEEIYGTKLKIFQISKSVFVIRKSL